MKHEYRSNQFQVEELLKTIDKMVTENNGGCFTNEMLQEVEQMIKEEVENIRQSPGNMTEEEIRKEANRRVYKVLIRLTGVGTVSVSSETRIVILGKTGSGKSSLANTIFREESFKINHTPNSETRQCQATVNGRSITLVDTPGFFDTDRSEEEMKPEIVRCITECAPGPHAFLIVLKVEKITKQEQEVINKIQEYFSEEALKYATVVFTHGDDLPEGEKIEDFFKENKHLSDLVKKCGGRCHVIDNKYWKEKPRHEYRSNHFQVEDLLKTIDKMVTENNGGYYTNEMLQAVEQMIKHKEEKIRQSSGTMTEEKIRKEANRRVYKVLIRLTGVGTGALLGALLGVAAITALAVDAKAAGAAAAGAAIKIVGVAVAAVGGVLIGGVRGYHAAEGADTPWEAAKRTAGAIKNQPQTSESKDEVDKLLQPKLKYN
ncbi:GTPase IMAP family member 7-like [Sparus aurata]|uniref:GTPase IMAP family member 7-like n=1 Tax=Sparus aurata TaxID=8175 RepID=UPI0011C1A28A|nr:GTPase IMAP family member 7-like [Sparus aurata]